MFQWCLPSSSIIRKKLKILHRSNQTVSLDIISASSMSSNSGYSSALATHLAYGDDVEDLELNGFISTGTDLTTATVYKVTSIMDSLHSGKAAFLYRV